MAARILRVNSIRRALLTPATWQRALSTVQRRHAGQPAPTEQFLSGTSTPYAEAMYEAWQQDPSSVHASWRALFNNESHGLGKGQSYTPPGYTPPAASAVSSSEAPHDGAIYDHIKVERLMRAYEVSGHHIASLDPLGILDHDLSSETPSELTLEHYGFTEADLKKQVTVPPLAIFDTTTETKLELGQVLQRLQEVYCHHIGYEYMFMTDRSRVKWMQAKVQEMRHPMAPAQKQRIARDILAARGFELFLQKKFVSEKRFGIDGGETLIAGMRQLLRRGSELGVEMAVLGMPHRGRLNVLANVLNKPVELILNEFQSNLEGYDEGSGDVKYHLGMSSDVTFDDTGASMHLTLMANPSHLEAVNPVVLGKARAEQDYRGDTQRKRVVPILLHGDAAFAGQGVVYETFGFAQLPAYTTGGTIHIVVNNQIGFTTDPRFARSTPYCTDLAKMLSAPIFHVNGDDAEAVVRCCQAAMEWRQEHGCDVVVDIVCYRRFGHNEADQPSFTQPLMYKKIGEQDPVDKIYNAELIEQGVIDEAWVQRETAEYDNTLNQAWEGASTFRPAKHEYLGSWWSSLKSQLDTAKIYDTGVDKDLLEEVGEVFSTYPEDFKPHKSLVKILKNRHDNIMNGDGMDWATAEGLAFGSLLMEGKAVRLSGQDVERGTFSQRHHVLHDQDVDGKTYCSLRTLAPATTTYSVSNSHLSEYGVLGFELGFSLANPQSLVCWEAQFGDFSNTAQCIIDQFITSGESKWKRQTGLVLLLPHGYEGMGPEHSSARLERFLQMCNDDETEYPEMGHMARKQIQSSNMQVANCTTPANYFHILRRQVHRDFRKPLVIMTPKSLLRHPECKSTLADMSAGTRFLRLIPEEKPEIVNNTGEIKRVVLCSGKVYYDLLKHREDNNINDVAIGRVEQISPFPFDLVHRMADQYPNAEVVWCQEEPKNMGAWSYVNPRIETALSKSDSHSGERPRFAGRKASASVATGDKKAHVREQNQLIVEALE